MLIVKDDKKICNSNIIKTSVKKHTKLNSAFILLFQFINIMTINRFILKPNRPTFIRLWLLNKYINRLNNINTI